MHKHFLPAPVMPNAGRLHLFQLHTDARNALNTAVSHLNQPQANTSAIHSELHQALSDVRSLTPPEA